LPLLIILHLQQYEMVWVRMLVSLSMAMTV